MQKRLSRSTGQAESQICSRLREPFEAKTFTLEPSRSIRREGSEYGHASGNKALVRRFYEEIDKGNIDAMDELVAENYVNHHPPPFPGLASGREGLKQAFRMFWEATPGHHVIEDQIAEGDKVVTRLRGVGKHEGELAGMAPTGNDLDVGAVDFVARFRSSSSLQGAFAFGDARRRP